MNLLSLHSARNLPGRTSIPKFKSSQSNTQTTFPLNRDSFTRLESRYNQTPLLDVSSDWCLPPSIASLIQGTPSVGLHLHAPGSMPWGGLRYLLLDQMERPNEWSGLRVQKYGTPEEGIEGYQRDKWSDSPVFRTLFQLPTTGEKTATPPVQTLKAYLDVYERSASLQRSIKANYLSAYMYALHAGFTNTRYVEYRINPLNFGPNSALQGMNKDRAYPNVLENTKLLTSAVVQGIEDARITLKESGKKLDYGIIFSGVRVSFGPNGPLPPQAEQHNERQQKLYKTTVMARLATDLRTQGYPVVGVDLAGDELNGPVSEFKHMLQIIHRHNQKMIDTGTPEKRLGITIHAGETEKSGNLTAQESIQKSVLMAWDPNTPVRLGHCVHLFDNPIDPSLILLLKNRTVGIEACPSSNVHSGAVPNLKSHPIGQMLAEGLLVSVDVDNETISNTSRAKEMALLLLHQGIGHEQRKTLIRNGIETAFIFDSAKKQELLKDIDSAFQRLESDPVFHQAIQAEKVCYPYTPPPPIAVSSPPSV